MAEEKKEEKAEEKKEAKPEPKSEAKPETPQVAPTPAPAAVEKTEAPGKEEKKEPAKKEKPANCASCNKSIKKKRWYYRNGKYYCTKRCFKTTLKRQDKPDAAAQAPSK